MDDKLCDHNGFSHEISCFKAGAVFAIPLAREEGFMRLIKYLEDKGFSSAASGAFIEKDKILGVKK